MFCWRKIFLSVIESGNIQKAGKCKSQFFRYVRRLREIISLESLKKKDAITIVFENAGLTVETLRPFSSGKEAAKRYLESSRAYQLENNNGIYIENTVTKILERIEKDDVFFSPGGIIALYFLEIYYS